MSKLLISIVISLLVINVGVSIWAYPQLPEPMAVHWGINGKPDGYADKLYGVLLMPVLLVVLTVFFAFLPKLDPLKKNWEEFKQSYLLFIVAFVGFMTFVHVLSIGSNLTGNNINFGRWMLVALGLFIMFLGRLMPTFKRNWFIGIRTPWTISNDEVWAKTHVLGSKLFMLTGISTIASVISAEIGFYVFMATMFGSVFVLMVYSYLEFRKITQSNTPSTST
jgi:uncharacterized membrane protein